MSLAEARKGYQEAASRLGNYKSISKYDLARGYALAKRDDDKNKMNYYFSALMDRYWYKILQWVRNSSSLRLPSEEFVGWLEDSILIAFRWALGDLNNPIYNDPNGPDKVINRCCFSTRGREYQYYNKDKRKNSTQAVSIYQEGVDSDGQESLNILDHVASSKGPEPDGAEELINLFLAHHNPVGAIILDGIAYQDSFKDNKISHYVDEKDSQGRDIKKKYSTMTSNFDMRKLVRHLKTIDEKFIYDYFCKKYDLKDVPKESLVTLFSNMNYNKIHRSIEKTFREIRENKNLLSYLV